MSTISLLNPTIGIESIGRYENGRMALPSGGDAQIVGGQVTQSTPALYEGTSVRDIARSLIAPRIPDPAILQPTRFDAAFYDVIDKMETEAKRADTAHPALALLRDLKEVRDRCRENLMALNMV